jgi:hypothetical protein
MKKVIFILTFMLAALAANAMVTRLVVKISDLPKTLTDNIAKEYPGFTIKEATKITDNKTVTYDVLVNKGTTSETLVYNQEGKFIKKLNQKSGSTMKSDSKSSEMSHTPKK